MYCVTVSQSIIVHRWFRICENSYDVMYRLKIRDKKKMNLQLSAVGVDCSQSITIKCFCWFYATRIQKLFKN
jgi:hypothetical protein